MLIEHCEFSSHLPSFFAPTLMLLRRRLYMSREIAVEVVRARCWVSKRWVQFMDGTRLFRAHCVDDKRHGIYQSYYADGQPYVRSVYEHDKLHGLHQSWRADGQPDVEIQYERGIMIAIDIMHQPSTLTYVP